MEDFDGDGAYDVFVPLLGPPGVLYRNRGDGTFEDVTAARGIDTPQQAGGAAWGDIDGDGDPDLLVAALLAGRTLLYINDGTGHFFEDGAARIPRRVGSGDGAQPCPAEFGVSLGDIDRDGDLDVFIAHYSTIDGDRGRSRLLINDGRGAFTDETEARGGHVNRQRAFGGSFADIDGDRWPDLLVTGDFGTSALWVASPAGQLREASEARGTATDHNGMGSAIGDIDGDGDLDWFVSSIGDAPGAPARPCDAGERFWCIGNRLYLNDGRGHFTDGTDRWGVRHAGWAWGVALFDPDADGDLDIFVANGLDPLDWSDWPGYRPFLNDRSRLWLNEGPEFPMVDGALAAGIDDDSNARAAVPFDADGDGDLDLLVVRNHGRLALYRNEGKPRNGWLRVRLRGTSENSHGIGATVHLQRSAGGEIMRRDITTNSGFASTGPAEAYFGLGPARGPVHRLTIDWPASGRRQVLHDIPIDRQLVVQEEADDAGPAGDMAERGPPGAEEAPTDEQRR